MTPKLVLNQKMNFKYDPETINKIKLPILN